MSKKSHPRYVEEAACAAITGGVVRPHTAIMIHESVVTVTLNGREVVRTQCLAHELEQMAVGFLLCEGLVQTCEEITGITVDPQRGGVHVTADVAPERLQRIGARTRLAAGGGRMAVIDRAAQNAARGVRCASDMTMTPGQVLALGNRFNNYAGLYQDSRFVHSAALSDGEDILCFSEDVGRHNAIDKVLGSAFQNGDSLSQRVLLCSGRFSLEMVSKAARVGIPIYISPAAASIEAMQLAEHIGMTLCGRLRHDGAILYSAAWRITD
jgi:FdhD protein